MRMDSAMLLAFPAVPACNTGGYLVAFDGATLENSVSIHTSSSARTSSWITFCQCSDRLPWPKWRNRWRRIPALHTTK
ncbi:hypothetical protein BKA80DRAFT_266953 [Phyllosticta citrichinensis]